MKKRIKKANKVKKLTDSDRLKWCYDKTIAMMPIGYSLPFKEYCARIDQDIVTNKKD